jgi:drug/metabolite transporter (DMT)-like permease
MALAPASSEHSSFSGMALAGVAFALLTSVDTIFKLISEGHPAYQILFVNSCFALIPIFVWVTLTGGPTRLRTLRLPQHLARGSTSVLSAFAAIYAYSRLPLTDFYAIVFAGPLIVTALSAFWLGEEVDRSRWFAIGVGFTGILFIANPFQPSMQSQGAMFLGRFAAFISVFCYALSSVMVRRMRLGETNVAFSFYGYVAALLIGGVLYMARGAPPLAIGDVSYLMLSGTLAGMSSICLMTAYHRTPVALVAPFQYTQIIWGALAGYLIWKHVPDANLVMGATIVAGSGMFVIYREFKARANGD